MRSNEERIASMHKRAAEYGRESRRRKVLIAQTASIIICLAVIVTTAILMPGFRSSTLAETATGEMNASIFTDSPMLGYIVIGILAFLLGTAVTVLCFRLKKWEQEENSKAAYD
ncbi:MAG: DUF4179 domain-containing protein [Mogibacterium sp.]|nr:DUF4179 domain-containing protein [Mogibacterium sp.]